MGLFINQIFPGTRGVSAIQHTPHLQTGGVVDQTAITPVNLENKTGTSNQALTLYKDRTTYAARKLDFSA